MAPAVRSLAQLPRALLVLQAILLAAPARAERSAIQGSGVALAVSRHGTLHKQGNDTEEPLLKGTLSNNLDQLEREKDELEKMLADKLRTLVEARKERVELKDQLWNVTSLLKRLQVQKAKNDRKISRANAEMLNISSQYETQVHAAKVALACLAGNCGAEDLKIWESWACKGKPSPESLTTPDPSLTTTEEPPPPPETEPPTQPPPPVVRPVSWAATTTVRPTPPLIMHEASTPPPPASTFAVGSGSIDDSLDGLGRHTGTPTASPTNVADKKSNDGKGKTVRVYVGDKKVVEVNTSHVSRPVKVGVTVGSSVDAGSGVNVTVRKHSSPGVHVYVPKGSRSASRAADAAAGSTAGAGAVPGGEAAGGPAGEVPEVEGSKKEEAGRGPAPKVPGLDEAMKELEGGGAVGKRPEVAEPKGEQQGAKATGKLPEVAEPKEVQQGAEAAAAGKAPEATEPNVAQQGAEPTGKAPEVVEPKGVQQGAEAAAAGKAPGAAAPQGEQQGAEPTGRVSEAVAEKQEEKAAEAAGKAPTGAETRKDTGAEVANKVLGIGEASKDEPGEPDDEESKRPERKTAGHDLDQGAIDEGHPNLDGNWTHLVEQMPSQEQIHGDKIVWSNRNVTEFHWVGDKALSLRMMNTTYVAHIQDDKLVWNDGDIWSRTG